MKMPLQTDTLERRKAMHKGNTHTRLGIILPFPPSRDKGGLLKWIISLNFWCIAQRKKIFQSTLLSRTKPFGSRKKPWRELFGVDKSSISRHLKNIFAEGELQEEVVVAKFATTTPHGAIEGKTQTKDTQFYNLDAIISVGYRVNSHRATQFRIWATGVLKEYMTKGFALDDDRLKQGKTAFGKDYFRELLERVRSIRASERRIWQQITDIFAECSIDYDRNSQITHDFYAMVQNKFHYAIVGQTGGRDRLLPR